KTGPKPRLAIARITLPEISWLSAVILLLHFTPHTVSIIKPQDTLFDRIMFPIPNFLTQWGRRKKEQGRSNREEGTKKREEGRECPMPHAPDPMPQARCPMPHLPV
ncbi:MAG: hypothetical protein WCD53_20880, partial [Microcoleus sp.]